MRNRLADGLGGCPRRSPGGSLGWRWGFLCPRSPCPAAGAFCREGAAHAVPLGAGGKPRLGEKGGSSSQRIPSPSQHGLVMGLQVSSPSPEIPPLGSEGNWGPFSTRTPSTHPSAPPSSSQLMNFGAQPLLRRQRTPAAGAGLGVESRMASSKVGSPFLCSSAVCLPVPVDATRGRVVPSLPSGVVEA